MTRDELQDEALRLSYEWRKVAANYRDDDTLCISGRQMREICEAFSVITDSVAKLCN